MITGEDSNPGFLRTRQTRCNKSWENWPVSTRTFTLGMSPCRGGGACVCQWSQELCRLGLKSLAGSTLPDWSRPGEAWQRTAPSPPGWGLGMGPITPSFRKFWVWSIQTTGWEKCTAYFRTENRDLLQSIVYAPYRLHIMLGIYILVHFKLLKLQSYCNIM